MTRTPIVAKYLTNSMALVADSFHMLSDVLSILIALLAVHYSSKKSKRNTYDWARAEILGAMANAVFLLALVFTIFLNAIQRIVIVETVKDPLLILAVGGAGLAINIFGLIIFGGHSHEHGHSHGHHDHQHHENLTQDVARSSEDSREQARHNSRERSASQMNMRGVFLHVLGDALGSVVVIVSAVIIYFVQDDWRFYVDPAMSLVMCLIICYTTVPLLRSASSILLQSPPKTVDLKKVEALASQVPGVIGIHDLHIWQLSSNCIIATVHVIVPKDCNFINIAQELKKIFHQADIHSTTIQPEFLTDPPLEHSSTPISSANQCDNVQKTHLCHSSNLEEGFHTVSAPDAECLLKCLSENCYAKMCCDGVRNTSPPLTSKDDSTGEYDNPCFIGQENRQSASSVIQIETIAGSGCVISSL